MTIIEYQHGPGHWTEVAPESYLNIGAWQLMNTHATEYAVMRRATRDTAIRTGQIPPDAPPFGYSDHGTLEEALHRS